MKSFAKLDIFKKLPKDLTEPTFCGAIGIFLMFSYSSSICDLYRNSGTSLHNRNFKVFDSRCDE